MSETENNSIENLIAHAEDYLKTRQELSKLVALEKGSAIAAKAISTVIVFSFFLFFFVFASIALCWFIAEVTGRTSLGFLIVAALYLIIALLLFANRDKWLETPFINSFIKKYFESKTHE
jgi:hypothetical protein